MEHVIRTFGRIHGKKLSTRQQLLVDNLLGQISPQSTNHSQQILEIGFGNGEHLRELAITNPNAIIIGAEPYINGVASLLSAITNENNEIKPEYKNIRIWPDDVRKLLTNQNFNRIWILHPDPWPKARHEKRRLLSSEFLGLLANHLAPDGKIIIGTDHHEYYDWITEQSKNTPLIINNEPLSIINTRYQKKNMANTNAPKYLVLSHKNP